jgi:PhnB protein
MEPTLTPYLNFDGNTAEAMEFYQSVLGGELTMQTYGEAGMKEPPGNADKIMHASLKNGTLSFMASDGNPEKRVQFGNNVNMSIVGTDEAKLTDFFDKLAKGGVIVMPMAKQFWGDTFGMLTDKFGVHWMIDIPPQSQK